MTEVGAEDPVQVEKFHDRASALYGAYRQTGWALSTTIIGFATVLLAWGLPASASGPVARSWIVQASLSLVAIASAFAQQFFYYQGSMKQARALFEPAATRQKAEQTANETFSRADLMAGLSCGTLIAALLASMALWFVRAEPAAREQAAPTSAMAATDDGWQKMRECSAQVDRIATKGDSKASSTQVLGRQSHYSPKLNRCFVWESSINREAEKDRTLPMLYDELSDAFEGKLLAICTDSKVSGAANFCTVQDKEHFGDCGFCRTFISERLAN